MINSILNKGGAGVSLSRDVTVEKTVPLVEQANELLFAYEAAKGKLDGFATDEDAKQALWYLRTDISKLSEIVYSNKGTVSTGTHLDAADFDLGTSDRDVLNALTERERAFRDAIDEQYGNKNHHIRTLAAYENALKHTNDRLRLLSQRAQARLRGA